MYDNEIEVVRGGSEDKECSPRYIIISKKTGEVIDDSNGFGYHTKAKAYAAYMYKSFEKNKDNDKEYKKKCVRHFCNENPVFIQMLEDKAYDIVVGRIDSNNRFNSKLVEDLLNEYGYTDLEFSSVEFLKYWC